MQATAAVIIDGDPSWFNNPQYKISCPQAAVVNISLYPVNVGADEVDATDGGQATNALPMVSINVVQIHPSLDQHQPSIGDALSCVMVATDKAEGVYKTKGQEASIWHLRLEANAKYFIVPSTQRKGQRCMLTISIPRSFIPS
jgi:hypothetical protein